MARRIFSVLMLLPACGLWAVAQSSGTAPAASAIPGAAITLGQSLVPLYGPWKFHIGDSPADPATGGPLWAERNFDDSSWETVDLAPQRSVNPFHPTDGVVAGWGARGHAGYSGYAWYRVRVSLHAPPGERLALAGPGNFDDAYQLFLNGALLGEFGRFDTRRPRFFYSEPMVFPLPETSGPERSEEIAFRFWMSPSVAYFQPDAGGLRLAPQLGSADAAQAVYQLGWLDLLKQNAVWALTGVIYLLPATVAFAFFLFNRSDRVYLWIGILFSVFALGGIETALTAWTELATVRTEEWICYVFVVPAINFAWFMLLRAWFGMIRPVWLPWCMAALAFVQAIAWAGALDLLSPAIPSTLAPGFDVLSESVYVIFLFVAIWMAFRFVPRLGGEGWLLIPPLLLSWVDWLARRLVFLHIPRAFHPFGILVSLQQISGFLIALAMCALLVRRWVLSARAQREMTMELKQAHEVQQVLIPEAVPPIPGFAIHSVYQPAGQVGGDFFQILPAKDGGVLVCIGDVSGKGTPAAMTVSLLVGTVRTLAHYTQSPGEILAAMNQRMLGRSRGGFTTCLVLLATPDGALTVANAGHIPPYLNGRELQLDGGLPLGLAAQSGYPESTFKLKEDEQVTLLTDGVVEARALSGELFGFDRTAAISTLPAEKVAETAQAFGQDDDITVLTITRLGAGASSHAPQIVTMLAPTTA